VRALAQREGGRFTLSQASRALAMPREDVDARLRPLIARQVFELDFEPSGETAYKLSPAAKSRALLQRAQR
jgi:hypothetical protein